MSTTFRFVDSTDRTAGPQWDCVMYDQELKTIERHNEKMSQNMEVSEAIANIRTLRFDDKSWWIGAAADFTTTTKVRDEGKPIQEHEIRETWINLDTLLASIKTLKNYVKVHQLREVSKMSDLPIKRAKRLVQKLDNGLVRIADVSAVNDFARAEAYALFVACESSYAKRIVEGYLGHGGMTLVPLQRARMFDSETAVKKFLQNHYFLNTYPKIQVVKIQLNMIGLTSVYDGKSVSMVDRLEESRIQHAAAFVQKENLEHALLNASKERLLERVAQMDQVVDTTSTVKRRI